MLQKAQSAIELMILISGILFFFTVFFVSIQIKTQDKLDERKDLLISQAIYEIQDEINLAFESENGYQRAFTLPERISNLEYNVTIVDGLIYLRTLDGRNAIAVPSQNITGQPVIGDNLIRKTNGEVYLNE